MDINNELKLINGLDENPKDLIKKMNEIMAKKLHLFKVMEFIYTIESFLDNKKYKKHLSQMKIFNLNYPDRPIMIQLVDSQQNDILRSPDLKDLEQELRPIIEDIVTNKVEYTNVHIKVGETIKINLKDNYKQEIFNNLLSYELLKTLEYSQMQLAIEFKSSKALKKSKV